ncbi:FliH/SctL family protein [Aquabacterium sp. A08]|uniref:FliH/SctL family protein n=1 Tax=Aquabacterium sp. A08 TaxID=2718532 RepID=UPI001421D89F|nr:FliH/SctL family protein [Aquabacterium sp. A08]NIC41929.1 flagellar assembly protein FliH [Aquabacterium sp. A08]NIC41972.1 flagellar assembly protein FliH [Aquabacterium sp. A08]
MPSSNRHTSPYHRFIPREEVEKVSAWEFAPVGEAPPAAAPLPAAEPEAPTVSPEWIEEVRQQARAEGFEHGRQAGAEETRQALEAPLRQLGRDQAARLAQVLQQAQADLATLEQGLTAQVLELACDLARQVVRRELATPLEPLKAAVQEALALLVEDGKPATLRLHPDDLALLQAEPSTPWAGLAVQLQADDSLTPGGCVVESPQGAVDATVEKRWARAVANLGLQAPWKPGELADV